jgi:hypothetical protein
MMSGSRRLELVPARSMGNKGTFRVRFSDVEDYRLLITLPNVPQGL